METTAMQLISHLSIAAAQVFVAGLWQGLVLISVVALCLRLFSGLGASVRFAICGVAFLLIVSIPFLHVGSAAVQPSPVGAAAVHLRPEWGMAIACLWAMLTAFRGWRLLSQSFELHRIWKRAKPVPVDSSILALLRASRRSVELCTSADVDAPSVIGFFSPRLLIPQELFTELTGVELRNIVLHECEHLRRSDDWINLLQKIGIALFPLNPALLWLETRLSFERELACDAGVVAATSAAFDYAHCLTRLAEHRLQRRTIALSLSAWSRQSELARRVHSLLRPVRNISLVHARVILLLFSIALGAGGFEMARAPFLVSFDNAPQLPVAEATTATLNPSAGRVLPVAYRQAAQPHATLLKAVSDVGHTGSRRLHPASAASRTRTARKQSTEPEFRIYTNRAALPPVRAVQIEFSPSYAAVPFANGWLIIQL